METREFLSNVVNPVTVDALAFDVIYIESNPATVDWRDVVDI